MEEFKIITGFENYSISNLGNVINNKTNRILKPGINGNGYKHVILNKKNHRVHRLVALAFLPNPDNKVCVDHKDNNKSNNNINNLRWCTIQENNQNTSLNKNNTSGYKGIIWHKHEKRWLSRIKFNYKDITIGYYDNIEDAIIARYKKAKQLFGDFINEIEKNQYNIALLKKQKQKELREIEELEKELEAILNK
jgi:hypothetical protein